jgi:hypothetical protein
MSLWKRWVAEFSG